jgi:hypothetical protein
MDVKVGLWHQGKNMEGVWEQGAEKNIWTYEGGSSGRLETVA